MDVFCENDYRLKAVTNPVKSSILDIWQPAFNFAMLTRETLEQGVKYVQNYQ